MTKLLLGIDGGGSKTKAVIADASGSVIASAIATSSNHHSVGFEQATQALTDAIVAAMRAANLEVTGSTPWQGKFEAACFGMAGVGREQDQERFESWATAQQIARKFRLVNDAEIILAAGTEEHWGVVLICGTGSLCYGLAQDGRRARAGGWGYLLGDEGSGYSLAIHALKLATQTADGRTDATQILQAILDEWKLRVAEDLLGFVYRPDITVAQIAQIAPRVLELAKAGDAHAKRLFDRHSIALARQIESVVKKLKLEAPPLAFGGGLICNSPELQSAIRQRCRITLGRAHAVHDPSEGAISIAKRMV
jgi:N-acetylglucosamine kinase-like BadF-type ATPase